MGEEIIMTESQKNIIYKEMLVPLKLKISQILLYDTTVALEFLQEYNEILMNEDMIVGHILQRITKLEFKIQNYMNNEGKEKAFEEKSRAFIQKIEELKVDSLQLSLEEFEHKFEKIKRDYKNNTGNYNFKDREKIEREVYALQAGLIMRQVSEGKTTDEIQKNITEDDKTGLTMFVLEKINSLSQQKELQDVMARVNNIVMTDEEAVLKPELWSWLNVAETGVKYQEQLQINQQENTSTSIIVAPTKKNISIMDRISKMLSKEPTFPLQPNDLRKINIDWLSKYIPKTMLYELEENKLRKENKQADNRYIPEPKAVIYNELRKIKDMFDEYYKNDDLVYHSKKTYKYLKENGAEFLITIREHWTEYKNTEVTMESGDIKKTGRDCNTSWFSKGFRGNPHAFNETLMYASLLDKIFNTDFEQQLLQDAQEIYIDRKRKKSLVYKNLMQSLEKMLEEYEYNKLSFEATENAKRKKFYEIHGFKEQLKLEDAINEKNIGTKNLEDEVNRGR